jgi:hypothetical protein
MRHERSGSFRISSERRGGGLLVQAIVLGWAAVVYLAYWIRYLPATR